MKRPSTYKEWRHVWQSCNYHIGCHVAYLLGTIGGRRVPIDRNLWRLVSRAKRVKMRLEAEHEAFDATMADAILEMLAKEQP